jgi:hypothetical protein
VARWTRSRPIAVGVVCAAGLALGAGATIVSAQDTVSAHDGTAPGSLASTSAVAVAWDAYAVGAHESSLELVVQRGACGTIQTRLTERRASVQIEVTEQQRRGACLAVAATQPLVVPLAHALAGRAIEGPSRRRVQTPLARRRQDHVPRLIGFGPADAMHALALVSLHGRVSSERRAGGLRRVIAQRPAAGARAPASRIVRITLAGP